MKLNFRSLVAVVGLVTAAAGLLGGTSASAQSRAATPPTAQSRDSAYRVRPGDKLFISVWKEEGLAQTAIVRPDGGFTFPLAGELNATDKTVAALAEEIRARLVRLIPEAVVTVDVAELRGARVYIIGQVQMPGEFIMVSTLDVLQALSMAGGVTAFAKPTPGSTTGRSWRWSKTSASRATPRWAATRAPFHPSAIRRTPSRSRSSVAGRVWTRGMR